MDVEMGDALARLVPGVGHHTIASLGDPGESGGLCSSEKEPSEDFTVAHRRGGEGRDVAARDDQNVNWGAGCEVVKRDHILVGEQNTRRRFTRRYAAENAAFHGGKDIKACLRATRAGKSRKLRVKCEEATKARGS
jgi:hypothetical protein